MAMCIGFLFFGACKKTNSVQNPKANKNIAFEILDAAAAKKMICTDRKEHYFEDVRSLEMSIQMSEELNKNSSRDEVLTRYVDYLKNDAISFSDVDKKLILSLEDTLNQLLLNVKQKWIHPNIKLVKLKGNCYGPGVFYTRDDGIFIPSDQLVNAKVGDLISVFLHEIFHIMSRYNEDFRRKAYGLIGFEPIEGNLNFPDALNERILLNPDGVNMAYAITLYNEDDNDPPIKAIPVIHSNSENYNTNNPSFFSYIQFDLFRITKTQNGNQVNIGKIDKMVNPDIEDQYYPSFFDQIHDNTQYIIHPDEIMADNFMFAIFAHNNIPSIEFSEKGKQLCDKFQNLIFN